MNTIQRTILEQLGGNKFIAMTGANNFRGTNYKPFKTLAFDLGKFKGVKINYVEVTYSEFEDLYYIKFYQRTKERIDMKNFTLIPEKLKFVVAYDSVYAENLQSIFTRVTGLATRL